MRKMQENTDRDLGKTSEEIINECMVLSAIESTELALECGLRKDQIIISCKVSRPHDLVEIYRDLASKTDQPLHLGLTEAGMGAKGLVWSAASMGILLDEGIGDTVRVSLTPRPGGDRRDEVYAACELLQSLGLRTFAPSVTACPGCGRTTSTTFQELAESIQDYIRDNMPEWKRHYEGVEELKLAVMGCIVNGPGESKASNIGISLPGTGEAPRCPVYIDGQKFTTLEGTYDELSVAFQTLVNDYIAAKYHKRETPLPATRPCSQALQSTTRRKNLPFASSPNVCVLVRVDSRFSRLSRKYRRNLCMISFPIADDIATDMTSDNFASLAASIAPKFCWQHESEARHA